MSDPDGRAGPKIFVTHKKPHLDEVVAAWLLRTFDSAMKDCRFQFISNTPTGGDVPVGDEYVPVGVGRGKYDEHGLSAGHSATQLVFQDLLHRGLIPNNQHEDKALEWLVDYAHQEDTGMWEITDPRYTSFSIPAILRGTWLIHKDDQKLMSRGLEIIDAVMAQLNERAKFLSDWDKRIEFNTQWGKGVGVHSSFRGSDVFAYHHGYMLRVQTDPTKAYGDYRAPATSDVDLEPLYNQLNAQEPHRWFLHQSHKIVVSNDDTTSGRKATSLNLQQLIDLVKT